jgi:hypothetical protein
MHLQTDVGDMVFVQVLGESDMFTEGIVAVLHGNLTAEEGGGNLVELQDGTIGIVGKPRAFGTRMDGVDMHGDAAIAQVASDSDPMAFLMSLASCGELIFSPSWYGTACMVSYHRK